MIRTVNILFQEEQDPLGELLPLPVKKNDNVAPCRFVHLLNIYGDELGAPLGKEPIRVVESMRNAASTYSASGGNVVFLAACEKHHASLVPHDFEIRSCIHRRANDLKQFEHLPPLPFLFDVLGAARDMPVKSHDYLVYTNFDIAVQPFFYNCLDYFIHTGFDAVIVNRRTLSKASLAAPIYIGHAEVGIAHPGMDCFIFPRAWISSFEITQAITGIGFVMRSLLYNLVAKSDNLLFLTSSHLTSHYGDDQPWNRPAFEEASLHNRNEALTLWEHFSTSNCSRAFEELKQNFPWLAPEGER